MSLRPHDAIAQNYDNLGIVLMPEAGKTLLHANGEKIFG